MYGAVRGSGYEKGAAGTEQSPMPGQPSQSGGAGMPPMPGAPGWNGGPVQPPMPEQSGQSGRPMTPPMPSGQAWGQAPVAAVRPAVQPGPRLQKMLDRPGFYGYGAILYGFCFTLFLYPGFHGISFPALLGVTMAALSLAFRDLGMGMKKSDCFFIVSAGLLGLSNCLTGSRVLLFFNTCGIVLLLLYVLSVHFYSTEKWKFGKFAWKITCVMVDAFSYWKYFFHSLRKCLSQKRSEGQGKVKYIWLGVCLSVPMLIIVLGLLMSADAVFCHLSLELLGWIRFPKRFFYMCLLLVAGIPGAYGLLACFADGKRGDTREGAKWEPIVAITFLSIITAVYLVFCGIQISCLFLNVGLPKGYSYAEYAREGFFQLLFVCLLNLSIVLACISCFRESRVLKGILTLFSCCTFVMVASSAARMLLYIKTYQLTFLRILVLWALAVITVLLIGCLATVYKSTFPLFQYGMVVVTVCYIAFSLARPDYQIARYNLSCGEGKIDYTYLAKLSSDAVPALEQAGVLAEMASGEMDGGGKIDDGRELISSIQRNLYKKLEKSEGMRFLDYNFSYAAAGRALEKYMGSGQEK